MAEQKRGETRRTQSGSSVEMRTAREGDLEVQRDHLASHSKRPEPGGLEKLESPGMFVGGGALALWGLKNLRSMRGLLMAGIGGGLIFQGLRTNDLLGGDFMHNLKQMVLNTGASQSTQVRATITVDRPIEEVYAQWRDLSNLSNCMRHITSIERVADNRWHWKAHVPKSNMHLEWDAEIIDERENELIVWRSTESAEIQNEGMVEFRRHPDGRATEVHAHIVYYPPAGAMGRTIGKFLRGLNEQIIREDLRRFKQHMEAGEIPTTEGQSSGRIPYGSSPTEGRGGTRSYQQQGRA